MNSIDAELATLYARIAELEEFKHAHPTDRENKPWTIAEERTLIRYLRRGEATFLEIADKLKRSERAVLWRVENLINYHIHEDGPYTDEVCQWLMPHIPLETWLRERAKLL
jgi:hypothetical protein